MTLADAPNPDFPALLRPFGSPASASDRPGQGKKVEGFVFGRMCLPRVWGLK